MIDFEKKLAARVVRALPALAFVLALGLSVYARVRWMPIIGADMNQFLLPWTQAYAKGGLAAIAGGVGNHSILLQLLYWLAVSLPISTVTAIKLFSVACDYLMALGVALIVLHLSPGHMPGKPRLELLAFAIVVLLPLPMLNSAYWGQSDAIYAAPAVFSLYFLLRRRWLPAFLLYGLAFSVKLQAIFLLPLFIMVYLLWQSFSALWFLLVPAVWFASTLPAVLAGASPLVGLSIYAGQAGTDSGYYVNYPGLPALSHNWHNSLFIGPATVLAMLVLLGMLVFLARTRRRVRGEGLVLLAAWCVLACAGLLPGMHERYGYLGEVLLWLYFALAPGWRRFGLAAVFTGTAYCAYSNFLLGHRILAEEWTALINLAALLLFTRYLIKTLPPRRALAEE